MNQLELQLEAPNKDFIGKVIRDENPYVKILGVVEWSMRWDAYVAVAQVEGTIAIISVKEKEDVNKRRVHGV